MCPSPNVVALSTDSFTQDEIDTVAHTDPELDTVEPITLETLYALTVEVQQQNAAILAAIAQYGQAFENVIESLPQMKAELADKVAGIPIIGRALANLLDGE